MAHKSGRNDVAVMSLVTPLHGITREGEADIIEG